MEKKIDGELALQFASRNVQVRFGGQITALGPDGHTFTGYINDCKLDASHDDKNVAVKVTLDFKNKVSISSTVYRIFHKKELCSAFL